MLPVSRCLVTVRPELCVSGSGASTLFLFEKTNLGAFGELLAAVVQKPNNLVFFTTFAPRSRLWPDKKEASKCWPLMGLDVEQEDGLE